MRPAPASGKFRCEATLERELRARGFHAVAGVDEVGRGALFGAVFAGAVILSEDRPVRGLNDSKLLEPERREVLAERIRERAVAWAIGAVDAATIDRVNIYQASRMAMRLAVNRLSPAPDFLLVDAVPLELPLPQRALIKVTPAATPSPPHRFWPKCSATPACAPGTTSSPSTGWLRTRATLRPSTVARWRNLDPLPCTA